MRESTKVRSLRETEIEAKKINTDFSELSLRQNTNFSALSWRNEAPSYTQYFNITYLHIISVCV